MRQREKQGATSLFTLIRAPSSFRLPVSSYHSQPHPHISIQAGRSLHCCSCFQKRNSLFLSLCFFAVGCTLFLLQSCLKETHRERSECNHHLKAPKNPYTPLTRNCRVCSCRGRRGSEPAQPISLMRPCQRPTQANYHLRLMVLPIMEKADSIFDVNIPAWRKI